MAKVLNNLYDVVIVGGGPAGLTAGIYLARACYRVLIIEKEKFGGQITITSEVVNYPGVEKTSGIELTNHMRKQAENLVPSFYLRKLKILIIQVISRKLSPVRELLIALALLSLLVLIQE